MERRTNELAVGAFWGSASVTQIQLPHEGDNDGAPCGQENMAERYRA